MKRIALLTILHPGIYSSDREYWRTLGNPTFAPGPRGRRQAWRAYLARLKKLETDFGNVGMGRTRLWLAGKDITEDIRMESYGWEG